MPTASSPHSSTSFAITLEEWTPWRTRVSHHLGCPIPWLLRNFTSKRATKEPINTNAPRKRKFNPYLSGLWFQVGHPSRNSTHVSGPSRDLDPPLYFDILLLPEHGSRSASAAIYHISLPGTGRAQYGVFSARWHSKHGPLRRTRRSVNGLFLDEVTRQLTPTFCTALIGHHVLSNFGTHPG